MAANKRTDDRRKDTYFVGDAADQPSDGHIWVDASNTNRILVFRNGSWVTPRFDAITLTGTTTVTTLTATTINATTVNPSDATVASTLVAQAARVAGVASLATSTITTLTGINATVASTLTAQRAQIAGVASLSATNVAGDFTIPTPAASATGKVVLGNAAVPTTPTSTSGIVQIAALPGTPVGQSAVPATGTVFLTFDTARQAIAVNIAGSWFTMASMSLY